MTNLVLLAVALGSDAFSLCLGLSMARMRAWKAGLFILIVAALHVMLPLAGWYMGQTLSLILERYTVYLAAGVLFFLAYKLVEQALGSHGQAPAIPTGPAAMLLLGASVSLDSLPAGLVLSSQSYALVPAISLFGLTAGLMTALGLVLGRYLGLWAGSRAQLLGGLVLFLLGVKLLLRF
ncbi:MAG TPA: manganese efflux pump [Spirochaetia bacterium]|nr:manganese efflux pump [Spirochaetia bacterium]